MDIKDIKKGINNVEKSARRISSDALRKTKNFTEEAVSKTNEFIKDNEIDVKAKAVGKTVSEAAGAVGKKTTYAVHMGKKQIDSTIEKMNLIDKELKAAVNDYNATYTAFDDHGMKLFVQRERSVDLLENAEKLINSIANYPKSFDTDISEVVVNRKKFKNVCDFAKKEIEAAQRSAIGIGAGAVGGIALASLAPTTAIWIATTFGTASTGVAISALSGAAATKAALAWLGGGVVAAGGGGVAAGQAFLALAGPIGWSVAGATILTSIVLFANKEVKLTKEKVHEIESVLQNTERIKEMDAELNALLVKTEELRTKLNEQYNQNMHLFGKNYLEISEECQIKLGTLVNNAKSLAYSLCENISM